MTSEERKKELMEWLRAILLALIVGSILSMTVRPTLVSGNSMAPTLNDRNYLIIDKVTYRFEPPARGDIVVFKTKLKTAQGVSKDLIKRIIAVPGDELVVEGGDVFVNGHQLKESYVLEEITEGSLKMTIPPEKVFVLGDNRHISMDSRSDQVGLIPYYDIRGKILIRVLPVKDFGQVN